jgi:hypothetical protein
MKLIVNLFMHENSQSIQLSFQTTVIYLITSQKKNQFNRFCCFSYIEVLIVDLLFE